MTNTTDVKLICDKISQGRSVEDLTTLFYMNDKFDTKAKCREYINAVLKDKDLAPKKKVPMSKQLKDWFHAQPEPLKVTKAQLTKQIELIGMSGGSVQWYIRVYMEVIDITKKLIENK